MMAQSMQAVNAAVQPGWAGHVGRRSVSNRQPLVVPNFWHVTYDVGRYPTDLLGLQATRPAQAQVLVVPGNPGCAAFYRKFMQQLHTAFGGAADVMAVSHVGHDGDNISKGAVWGLHDQVDHKAQLLQELMAPGKPPVIILAHSIGSYIMLQVGAQPCQMPTAYCDCEHA
jgi:pimeloyl-ACP methyl ester carboxylesterase